MNIDDKLSKVRNIVYKFDEYLLYENKIQDDYWLYHGEGHLIKILGREVHEEKLKQIKEHFVKNFDQVEDEFNIKINKLSVISVSLEQNKHFSMFDTVYPCQIQIFRRTLLDIEEELTEYIHNEISGTTTNDDKNQANEETIEENLNFDQKDKSSKASHDDNNDVRNNVKEKMNQKMNKIVHIKDLKKKKKQKDKSNRRQVNRFKNHHIDTTSSLQSIMSQKAWFTYIMIGLNVIVFILSVITRNLSKLDWVHDFGLNHFYIVNGEYYRIATSMFLHIDFEHLLMNMLILYIAGTAVEVIFGKIKFLVIYLFGGLISHIISLLFQTESISLGASGAIYALIGALIVYIIIYRQFNIKALLQALFIVVLFTVLMSIFEMSSVNHLAHIAGFIAGALMMVAISSISNMYRVIALLLLIIVPTVSLYLIFSKDTEHILNKDARIALNNANFKTAQQLMNKTFSKNMQNGESYYIYGFVLANNEGKRQAVDMWRKGLEKYPKDKDLLYQMAVVERSNDQLKSSYDYVIKALDSDPKNKQYVMFKEELERRGVENQ